MRPRLATVVSSRRWEPRVVAAVRATGLARLVGRFGDPAAMQRAEASIDVVAFDTTAPWISPPLIDRWSERSITTIGFVPRGDRVARRELESCDLVFGEEDDPRRVLAAVVASAVPRAHATAPAPAVGGRGTVIPVVGGRGAPGCTEVALALASALAPRGSTLLTESDPSAPGIGLRLALPPGSEPVTWGNIGVLQGREDQSAIHRELERAAATHDFVVVDAGVAGDHGPEPSTPVLVVDASPTGVVRAGILIQRWTAPEPVIVANRMPGDLAERELALRRVRAATGLEPVAVVDRVAPRWGGPAPLEMVGAVMPFASTVCSQAVALR